jgi:putative Mn2+ efflux pump MntP
MIVLLSVVLLSLALAADAFAAALGQGAKGRGAVWPLAMRTGAAFGVAQAVAPLIGWGLATAFAGAIEAFDHWIAFGLLAVLGMRMIRAALKDAKGGDTPDVAEGAEAVAGGDSFLGLMVLAVAVSIDAAAAGVTLPALGAPVMVSVAAIGGTTFVLSALGVLIGRAGSEALGWKAEALGGVILIVIGVKVLIDHRAFG